MTLIIQALNSGHLINPLHMVVKVGFPFINYAETTYLGSIAIAITSGVKGDSSVSNNLLTTFLHSAFASNASRVL